jgi:UPF0716 protein FxsA
MLWPLLGLLFLVTPILEIFVIIQVGQLIGGWQTVVLLLAESALGAWLVKNEGRRTWTELRSTVQRGRLPGRELADAALVLVGGTLLLTPGFVTDVFGFFCVLPVTRPLARRALQWFIARRSATLAASTRPSGGRSSTPTGAEWWGGTGHSREGPVVRGEVLGDD